MTNASISKRIGTILLLVGPTTSLAISPFSNFDPINLVKLLFVTSLAFSVLGLFVSSVKQFIGRLPKSVWYASGVFILWSLVAMIFSDAPLNQQFWGVFGRNTGFLTYFSLIMMLVGSALVQEKAFYRKLVEALVLTAIPMTIYAAIQVAGRDPIQWSVMAPFATLGNVNFSSAFFGLASVCSVVLFLEKRINVYLRVLILFMVVIDFLIVLETGSIQGFMIFIAGVGIAGYLWLRTKLKKRTYQVVYLGAGVIGFFFVSLALGNIGPLARFVFSETVLYRFDYWVAGWNMTIRNPILGVGLDSYGDWYRELRGEVATLRTTPDRITNTAHNIYLDISASGGFPLLVCYLTLLALAARSSWLVMRRTKEFDPYFTAMFSAWLAYLIQAAISINQIGVGIWGWLFTGGLIGYEIATRNEPEISRHKRAESRRPSSPMPAASALIGILTFTLGFVLAFIPFSADAKFKDALQSNSLESMKKSVNGLGSTAYQYELALDLALKQNNESEAVLLTEGLLARYPRDFMAWQVRALLPSVPTDQRLAAQRRLLELDPFNNTLNRP